MAGESFAFAHRRFHPYLNSGKKRNKQVGRKSLRLFGRKSEQRTKHVKWSWELHAAGGQAHEKGIGRTTSERSLVHIVCQRVASASASQTSDTQRKKRRGKQAQSAIWGSWPYMQRCSHQDLWVSFINKKIDTRPSFGCVAAARSCLSNLGAGHQDIARAGWEEEDGNSHT